MNIEFRNLKYSILALIRIILVFVPQTGYIHPDEYFQSIEIYAGHFFNLEIDKPWEFITTFPIRSIGLNYIIFGLSYNILKICDIIAHYFKSSVVTPYALVVFPRAVFCLLTFVVDYTIYKLCLKNNEKYMSKLTVLASSYVIVIYGTHTFSNVTEMVLLSLLLYYVADSMTFSNMVIKQREYLNRKYQNSTTVLEKAKIHKLRLLLASDNFKNCFMISTITVTGFFNRPTFLIFAVCPVFFWLYRGIGYKSVTMMQFHYRMLCLLVTSLPSLIFFIVIDSFFYGYISMAEIEFMEIDLNNFIFTPLNFLKYNMNSDNLAIHGTHPKWLHLLINLPLLFNVIAICNFIYCINMCNRFVKRQWHYLPTIRSIKGLMTMTFLAPILLLSIFSHQEPRFLVPLIIPLVYLHAENILPEQDMALERHVEKKSKTSNKKMPNYLFTFWLIINVILALFYGFGHQGGIYPATVVLSNKLQMKRNSNFYVVTSHLYSIPKCLFLERSTETLYASRNTKYQLISQVKLYQEGSKDLNDVMNQLKTLSDVEDKNKMIYFLFPTSKEDELHTLKDESNFTLSYKNCLEYFPHLSIEAFPDLNSFFHNNINYYSTSSILNMFHKLKRLFSLQLCEIAKY